MENIKKILIVLLLLSTALFAEETTESNLNYQDPIQKELKIEFRTKPSSLLKNVNHRNFLKNFYYKNNYTPLWLNQDGLQKEKIATLFNHIENDLTLSKQGLLYKQYLELSKQLEQNQTQSELFKNELKLTSLYYDFLEHTLYGEIQWKNFSAKLSNLKRYKIDASWLRNQAPYNLSELLIEPNINLTMEEITPKNFGYKELNLALKKLYSIKEKGAWKPLPYFKILELGSTGDVVIQLRKRLEASNDYNLSCTKENSTDLQNPYTEENQSVLPQIHIDSEAVFDSCLEKAVKKFQRRHALDVDGVVGGGTRARLNMTVDQKIETVLLNIDRIKWLPRTDAERYVVVNIPEFMLHYIEYGVEKEQLRVIVGDTKHPTPVFNQKISFIVLNPYWKVPEGIVKREIVPAMVKNRNYLKKQGLEAHRTWDEHSALINVSRLNWRHYLYGNRFPYRLMQPPGPKNALGKIKFKFPNQFAVYLHDTPTKHLFERTVRAFSHGCVRLSNPEILFERIASFNDTINLEASKEILKGKEKKLLDIENQLPIHLIYLTAGMNQENEIEFRNDIYGYDKLTKRSIR